MELRHRQSTMGDNLLAFIAKDRKLIYTGM